MDTASLPLYGLALSALTATVIVIDRIRWPSKVRPTRIVAILASITNLSYSSTVSLPSDHQVPFCPTMGQ